MTTRLWIGGAPAVHWAEHDLLVRDDFRLLPPVDTAVARTTYSSSSPAVRACDPGTPVTANGVPCTVVTYGPGKSWVKRADLPFVSDLVHRVHTDGMRYRLGAVDDLVERAKEVGVKKVVVGEHTYLVPLDAPEDGEVVAAPAKTTGVREKTRTVRELSRLSEHKNTPHDTGGVGVFAPPSTRKRAVRIVAPIPPKRTRVPIGDRHQAVLPAPCVSVDRGDVRVA